MSAGIIVQYTVIALLVVASALYTLRRLAPKPARRWQATIASALLSPGRTPLAQRIGHWLQPRAASSDCSDGCSSCSRCGIAPPMAEHPDVQPLEFHPRRK